MQNYQVYLPVVGDKEVVAPALVALGLPHSGGAGVGLGAVGLLEEGFACVGETVSSHLSFQIRYDREYLRILRILYEIYLGLF